MTARDASCGTCSCVLDLVPPRLRDAIVTLPLVGRLVSVAVAIIERILRVVERLAIDVGNVRVVHGVRPAQVLVMADRRDGPPKKLDPEKCSPRRCADALVELAGPEPRLMRIGEEHRRFRLRLAGTDGPGVRADRLRHTLLVLGRNRLLRCDLEYMKESKVNRSNATTFHGSKCLISRGFTCGCFSRK